MIQLLKRMTFQALRAFLVLISFTMDIKVKADISFYEIKAPVEFEKNGEIIELNIKKKVQEPLEIQSFKGGTVKSLVNSVYVALNDNTFMTIETAPLFSLHHGMIFIKTPHALTLKTPHGLIETAGGEAVILTQKKQTHLWSIRGDFNVKDRASNKILNLKPGYSSWIGGILAQGSRAIGDIEAVDFEWLMDTVKKMGRYTPEEYQTLYDEFKPVSHEAVVKIADENQKKVTEDLEQWNAYVRAKQKKKREIAAERAENRKLYRKKVLDIPEGE